MNSVRTSISKRQLTVIAISFVVTLALLSPVTREAAAQTTHEVEIADFAFIPQSVTINPGDTIIWSNTDPVIYNLWFVFAANGSTYLLSDPIPPNTTWTHTFNKPVELQYYDIDRLWITGFINVAGEIHDVAVVDVHHMKSDCVPKPTVCLGMDMDVYVTVENQGDFVETFNVTAWANATEIGEKAVTLNPAENVTLTFTWTTTGLTEYDYYVISATADQVSGEVDLADNTLVDGNVTITHMGDVTGNGKVDIQDLSRVSGGFGSVRVNDPADSRYGEYWHPTPCPYCPHTRNADVTGYGKIDIQDVSRTSANFGWFKP